MKVVHIQRKRPAARFSIEGYFERVRNRLSTEADIRVHILPCFSRGVLRRIWNVLSAFTHQADINHVTGDVHYATLLLPRKRTLLTVHDCEVLHRLNGWKRWVVKWLWFRIPATRVAAMTVNSSETKRSLLEVIDFPEHKIKVVAVSVSPLYQPDPKPFNTDCPQILQIGTKDNKNIPRLAEALSGITCELHIVGPLCATQQEVLHQNNIRMTNHLYLSDQELADRYRQADIVSFVSTHEGFGMPIVEAQLVERVCITSNCSSMPEIAGQGACFVDPFDVDSIRTGFRRVISDPEIRRKLITEGRKNRKRFDAQQIADDFLKIYTEIHEGKCASVKAISDSS